MTNEEILSDFMQKYYSNEKLADLLAHAEDGKLVFNSCCCFIGIATADHALRGHEEEVWRFPHYKRAEKFRESDDAEMAFVALGYLDEARRAKLIPLIRAEMKRRDEIAAATSAELTFQEVRA